MSAPLSPSSLGNGLQLRLGSQHSRIGVAALDGLGTQPDSFSRTLANRINPPDPAPRKPESAPETPRPTEHAATGEPTRDPERTASASPARSESGQDASGKPAAQDGNGQARGSGASASGEARSEGDAAAEDAAASTRAGATAEHADAERSPHGVAGQAGDAARLAALATAAATEADEALTDVATASSPTDPAALAGLPAAIAALLAGRTEARSTADETTAETGTLQLTADGGRKSLQNSALLPKTELSAESGGSAGSGADTTPAFLLQGRELAAAAAARSAIGAGAGAMQGDALEAPGTTGSQPTGLAHTHGAMHLLRQASSAQAASPQLPVPTPAGEPGWAEDVGNQVRWMLGRAESKAELVLTPPNMGKLEVSINLNGDQTTAQFIASSQAARDALERALPQLREALQQAGIMLGDTNVSTSGQGREGEGREGGGGRGERGEQAAGGSTGATSAAVWLKQQQGMVDTFA